MFLFALAYGTVSYHAFKLYTVTVSEQEITRMKS